MIDFDFVHPVNSSWYQLVLQAQSTATEDPNICLIKLRVLGEKIARDIGLRAKLYVDDRAKQMDILEQLEAQGYLESRIAAHLHRIRQRETRRLTSTTWASLMLPPDCNPPRRF